MGQVYTNANVQQFLATVAYETTSDASGHPYVITKKKNGEKVRHTPEEISGIILSYLKSLAEKNVLKDCPDVVITIPAHFSISQRDATRIAAQIAGFKNVFLMHEPTAAAICYAKEIDYNLPHKIFIFDFGGGTLDCSILATQKGDGSPQFKVLGISGDNFLGGQNIDNILVDKMLSEFKKLHGIDLRRVVDPKATKAIKILKDTCEEAKRGLSAAMSMPIIIDTFYEIDGNPVKFESKITRAQFDDLCEPIWDKVNEVITEALNNACLEPEDITDLIAVGGSSRIPRITSLLTDIFHQEPKQAVHPDEAIAIGASVYNSMLRKPASKISTSSFISKKSHLLSSSSDPVPAVKPAPKPVKPKVTPEKPKEVHDSPEPKPVKPKEVPEKPEPKPVKPKVVPHVPVSDESDSDDYENEIAIIPDNILEILPLSIGIRHVGGVMRQIIPKSTPLPTSKKVTVTTTQDYQEIGTVRVYQGERAMVDDNYRVGKFDVKLPKRPKGEVQFDVTIQIDKNLNIKCIAKVYGSDLPETVCEMNANRFRLPDEEVERLKAQAELWRNEDKLKLQAVHIKNAYQDRLNLFKKAAHSAKLSDVEAKIKSEIRKALDESIPNTNLQSYIESMKKKIEELDKKYEYLLK